MKRTIHTVSDSVLGEVGIKQIIWRSQSLGIDAAGCLTLSILPRPHHNATKLPYLPRGNSS